MDFTNALAAEKQALEKYAAGQYVFENGRKTRIRIEIPRKENGRRYPRG